VQQRHEVGPQVGAQPLGRRQARPLDQGRRERRALVVDVQQGGHRGERLALPQAGHRALAPQRGEHLAVRRVAVGRLLVLQVPVADGGPLPDDRQPRRLQYRVALDESDAFFAEPERGLVLRVRKTGGVPSVVARFSDAPRVLTVDTSNVYVGTESVGLAAANTPPRLLRVAKSGKEPPVVLAALDDPARELAVTASHVFWSDGSAAFRIPKIGGAVEKIQEQACDLAIRDDALFFVTCGAPGSVWRLGLSDRKLSALATSLTSPRHVVADERAIHWITTGTDINPKSSDLVGCCALWTLER